MQAPESIRLEFLNSNGDAVRLIDLGVTFLNQMSVPPARFGSPLQVEIERKTSKAGNFYYEYSQNGLPLPDGLTGFLKVEGTVVPLGKVRPSKSGYPTREGEARILIGATMYKVTAYLTEGKTPYWIKVVAHIVPDSTEGLKKAHQAPRGGQIVF